jgi:hypothetical protein
LLSFLLSFFDAGAIISFSPFCISSTAVGYHPQDFKIAYQVHSNEGSNGGQGLLTC